MTDSYGVDPDAYLVRARRCLQSESPEMLFYAAFELRCCVEARQNEYLAAQRKFVRRSLKTWKAGPRSKVLNEIFSSERIAELIYRFDDAEARAFYYVPITKQMLRQYGRLGDVLHLMKDYRPPNHRWWSDTRERLLETYRSAWVLCQGELLTPPFINKDTGEVELTSRIPSDDPTGITDRLSRLGESFTMSVDYLKEPPSAWTCNL